MNRTFIYCRIDGPVSEITHDLLALQRKTLLTYAQNKNIEISGIYEDIGYTGSNLERPGLQCLMKDAKNDGVGVVLVANRERLFRGRMPLELEKLDVQPVNECKLS